MEKLTFIDENGNVLFTPRKYSADAKYTIGQLAQYGYTGLLNDIAHRLADYEQRRQGYEDLEEQGKLLELPCAAGDTVWYWTQFDPLEEAPFEGEVRRYEITSANTVSMIIVPVSSFAMSWGIRADEILNIEDFGKTVFLTKEEAEAALKEWVRK